MHMNKNTYNEYNTQQFYILKNKYNIFKNEILRFKCKLI